jgi:hypothetical protein
MIFNKIFQGNAVAITMHAGLNKEITSDNLNI